MAALKANGEVIGTVSEVHPKVCKAFDLPARAAVATVNLTKLFAVPASTIVFAPLSQYPSVSYDITIDMDHGSSAGELLGKLRSSSKLLSSVEVVDVYGSDSGAYKLTVRCTYQAEDRTLTDQEAKQEFASIEKLTS